MPPPRCESPQGTGRLGWVSQRGSVPLPPPRERPCPSGSPGSPPVTPGSGRPRVKAQKDGGTWEFPVCVARRPVPPAGTFRPHGRGLLASARSIPGTRPGLFRGDPPSPEQLSRCPVGHLCAPFLSQGEEAFPSAVNVTHREHEGGFPRSGFCAWGGKGITLHF